ncbi:class I SAM-dependent methyltransferase [Synechococcus sp. PCC 7336]|uniref:class I SAM-dependent methyltransferase n=1 Tax=Synechococcus sp. PCC 7336 TaxID=195250 RepID=UPI00035D9113|nr:class I SAM-dependent methyltransferase [Synechococcus sp. PCC 7336]
MCAFPVSPPLPLYRCLSCSYSPLLPARKSPALFADDTAYCAQCGRTYSLLPSGAIDCLGDRPLALTPAQAIAQNIPFAWAYERLWRTNALTLLSGQPFSSQREADILNELAGNADPILDLAAASGYWSRLLLAARPKTTIVALEISAPLLAEAAQRARPEWPHYSFARARAEALPFKNDAFAAVMSGGSLNELPFESTLAEVARVLQPQGKFVSMHIQTVAGLGHILQQAIAPSGMRFYSQSELRQQFQAVGLNIARYLEFGAIVFVQAIRAA